MVIAREHWDAVVAHARRWFPEEACGMLALERGVVREVFPMTNVAASPIRYEISSADLLKQMNIEDDGYDLGIFHSHTRTPPYPSATDIELAHSPDALYVIVSLAYADAPEMRAFHIRDGQVSEEAVELAR